MLTITEHSAVILILFLIGETRSDGKCGLQGTDDKIIGGEATEIDEYPWTALIRYKDTNSNKATWGCGGSWVGGKTILTAAHCVDNKIQAALGEIEFVRLGEYDYTTQKDCVRKQNGEDCADEPMDFEVANIVIHPERRLDSKLHDIAIIILVKVPPYTDFIRPICLPDTIDDISFNKGKLYVAGWGWTVDSVPSPSNIKKQTEVNHVSSDNCSRIYPKFNDKYQLCAGGQQGRNACRGDSGGPLMYSEGDKWILTGIVSFGRGLCGKVGFDGDPVVFTRVASYVPWINSVMLSFIDQGKNLWER